MIDKNKCVKEIGAGDTTTGDASAQPNPSRLCSYLPIANPYTTPALIAGTPTKILAPTTQKSTTNFTLDVPNQRFFFDKPSAITDKLFIVHSTMGISSSASNHTVTIELYKNGALEEGVGISRWISGGADQGAIAINGIVFLKNTDYIEIYVTDSTGGTVTLSRLTITIVELEGAV